jgi:hypothetical protein
MGEATHLPVPPCQLFEVDVRKRVREPGAAPQPVISKQSFAGQMWGLARLCADTDIDAGFAIVNWQQLCVAICEVDQTGNALALGQPVQPRAIVGNGARREAPGDGGKRQRLQKFTAVHLSSNVEFGRKVVCALFAIYRCAHRQTVA